MNDIKEITEKTLLPISLIIVLVGGVVWLTNIWYTASANASAIIEIKEMRKTESAIVQDKLDKIISDLYFIKGKLTKEKQDASD